MEPTQLAQLSSLGREGDWLMGGGRIIANGVGFVGEGIFGKESGKIVDRWTIWLEDTDMYFKN